MTPQETFYKAIEAMGLTELQQIDIKIKANEFARKEWTEGFERAQKITTQTLNIFK